MRTHMIDGTHNMKPVTWHDENSLPTKIKAPWKDFTPYTNVLWIRYILAYLNNNYKYTKFPRSVSKQKSDPVFIQFSEQTRELSKRLNPKTKIENGAFTVRLLRPKHETKLIVSQSAQEVLSYVVEQKWVSEEQLERYGVEDSLCDVSTFVEEDEESEESDSSSEDD